MMGDTYTREQCSKCEWVYFVCHGDLDDLSRPDVDAHRCPRCGEINIYQDCDLPEEQCYIQDGETILNGGEE